MPSEPLTLTQTLEGVLFAALILILVKVISEQGVLVEQLSETIGFPASGSTEPDISLNMISLMVNERESSPLQ